MKGKIIIPKVINGVTERIAFSFKFLPAKNKNGIKSSGYNLKPEARPKKIAAENNFCFLIIKNDKTVRITEKISILEKT